MRTFVLCLALAVFGPIFGASAHAYLETSQPAIGETLQAAPEQVTLRFSEPLELRFSTFRIAPLKTEATDPREIKLAAQDLTAEVMSAENTDSGSSDDEAQLAVLTSERTSQEVVLGLGDLSPGTYPQTYVVMWRLLSTDTHTSDDFITFTIAPDPPAPGTAEGN